MDELMLMEYLRDKGIGKNMSEQEFMNKFKEFMSKGSRSHYMRRHNYPEEFNEMFNSGSRGQHRFFDRFNRMSEGMSEEDMYEMMRDIEVLYHRL